jgi:quinolinate synthase
MSYKQEIVAEELYRQLSHLGQGGAVTCLYDMETCIQMAEKINEINHLKREQKAIILAHSYVAPEIVYGVADFKGDSYGLSKNAMEADCDTIIFAAVRFMGETAKILNPNKEVLIPGKDSGCTLADAVTAEQVRELKVKFPDHTFICYINTTASVKAECDVCVTSSNVYKIVENYPNDKIFFLPDRLMGENLQEEMKRRGVDKKIELFSGSCYVHEEYDAEMIHFLRGEYPGIQVVSHPECSPGVAAFSDYVGSTEQMLQYIASSARDQFLLLTECGLSARLQVEMPQKTFVGSCNMCRYMKSNTLDDILRVLKKPEEKDRILLSDKMMEKALKCIEQMFIYAEMK